jgi:ferric-dicitrate binding protein FerR (iron transport regulator)
VEVLGTRFTVDDRNEKLEVICFEGKVRASFRDGEKELVPGTGIEFSGSKNLKPISTKEEYPGMAKFSENYSNSGLDNVLKDMESFFGVRIENRTNSARYFSGTILTGNLDNALSIVTVSLGLNYKKIDEGKIVIF